MVSKCASRVICAPRSRGILIRMCQLFFSLQRLQIALKHSCQLLENKSKMRPLVMKEQCLVNSGLKVGSIK